MIKTTVLISCASATVLFSSCRVFKPVAPVDTGSGARTVHANSRMNADGSPGSHRVYKVPHNPPPGTAGLLINNNIENSCALQFKYALELDVMVEALGNVQLLIYIDEWWGTRYRYGGNSKSGIDCSAFAGGLIGSVYAVPVPRTVREQFQVCRRVEDGELQEGDLVFFNTRGPLTHVGVYLTNNKFVHASVSSGVTISDLGEPYYVKRYAGAGRIREAIGP